MRGLPPLLAVVLLLVGCSAIEQDSAGRPAGITKSSAGASASELTAHSQEILEGAVNAGDPGCSAAVGVEGQVVWSGVRGVADLASGAPITTDTVFDIASVSKQFTATAVLLLAGAGKLAVDDPLSEHVPGLPAWARTVTVEQLIHQVSGIPDYVGLLQDEGFDFTSHATQADALKSLQAVPKLEFAPGSQFEYSNSNYILLGEIVQNVSGESLPKFLAANIFQPLGLAMVLDPIGDVPNKAVSYEKGTGEYEVDTAPWEQIGDGSIHTTPSQLVRWADNYRTGKVGGQKLLDAQLAGAVPTDAASEDRYAAGIYILADGMLDHDGSWGGFVTAFRVSDDRRTAVAISCNTDEQDPEALADALGKLWI